jgi:hypothetical protein
MSHIRVLICRVDDPTTDHMTELAAFDLPIPDVTALESTTTLDDLETVTQQTGNAILRQVLQAQWDGIDAALVAQRRQPLRHPDLVTPGLPTWPRAAPRPAGQRRTPTSPRHHYHSWAPGMGLLAVAGTPVCIRGAAARVADPRGAGSQRDHSTQSCALPWAADPPSRADGGGRLRGTGQSRQARFAVGAARPAAPACRVAGRIEWRRQRGVGRRPSPPTLGCILGRLGARSGCAPRAS